jgi:hypothetical protein
MAIVKSIVPIAKIQLIPVLCKVAAGKDDSDANEICIMANVWQMFSYGKRLVIVRVVVHSGTIFE